jgi:hypothetical protein
MIRLLFPNLQAVNEDIILLNKAGEKLMNAYVISKGK